MSFFNVMKRMMEGKPAFEDEEAPEDKRGQAPAEEPSVQPSASQSTIQKGVDSSFPVVYVKRVKVTMSGSNMDVYAQIINTWPEEIELDKIRIMNITREIDKFLRGGEEHEFLIYSGPRPQKQYFEAQLDYKTHREGDYFEAVHDVTFMYHDDDKTFSVNEMRLRRPIRDIYG